MATGEKGQQIDLGSLSAQQLSQVKKQLDEEVQHLTNSYQNLRTAQQKFRDCIVSIKNGVAASVKDKPLLVPLTSSLYVPGRLADTENVLVDVGTGFYVEKSTEDAQKFYTAKIEELGKNIKDLENIVNGKANNLRVVEEVLRQKVLAGGQQQSTQAAAAAS
ncbi:putative prefoldin subunit 5 [Teratosphaeria destructans]|uniref:Prefoldin subunit 5 n=1 Tax=Teratosphaeria destructans TaxID=418781 RepID=A0A9W7SZK4_9PEZI|nr:putative prefoldin subunit 5 [Teratosphaeria destructans]